MVQNNWTRGGKANLPTLISTARRHLAYSYLHASFAPRASDGGGAVVEIDMLGTLRPGWTFDHDPLATLPDNGSSQDYCGLGTHGNVRKFACVLRSCMSSSRASFELIDWMTALAKAIPFTSFYGRSLVALVKRPKLVLVESSPFVIDPTLNAVTSLPRHHTSTAGFQDDDQGESVGGRILGREASGAAASTTCPRKRMVY